LDAKNQSDAVVMSAEERPRAVRSASVQRRVASPQASELTDPCCGGLSFWSGLLVAGALSTAFWGGVGWLIVRLAFAR
jgi:hypothetical protein